MADRATRREFLGMAAGAAACGVGIAAGVAQALPPVWTWRYVRPLPAGERPGFVPRYPGLAVEWADSDGRRWRWVGGEEGATCLTR